MTTGASLLYAVLEEGLRILEEVTVQLQASGGELSSQSRTSLQKLGVALLEMTDTTFLEVHTYRQEFRERRALLEVLDGPGPTVA
jgi:hypothetical protein